MVSCMSVDATLKGLASSFMEDLIAAREAAQTAWSEAFDRNAAFSIDVVALGALTYREVWDEVIAGQSSVRDEFLALRTFSVGYCKKHDSTYAPVLTPIAKGPTIDLSETPNDISILQPYWLA